MSEHEVSLTVNGESVTRSVEARTLLVHFIREDLSLTGTHIGCDTTSCGACTVLMNGKPVKSSRYSPCRPKAQPSKRSRAWQPVARFTHSKRGSGKSTVFSVGTARPA